jgi:hypothetical protein
MAINGMDPDVQYVADLATKAMIAHWNVKMFQTRHTRRPAHQWDGRKLRGAWVVPR